MNPLRDLRKTLTDALTVDTGIVVSAGGTVIAVRTRGGLKTFNVPSVTQYKPGDTVRFQGNILLGKSTSVDSIPVFKV